MKKFSHLSAFLLIGLLSLSACSQKAQQDTSAKATLDYENNLIIKPLDEYSIDQMTDNYNKLHSIAMHKCTSRLGTPYSYPESKVKVGSREYGFWNPHYIEQYGFGIFIPESTQEVIDETTQQNISRCAAEDQSLKELSNKLSQLSSATEITDRLRTEARSSALRDDTWQEARKKWWSCLEAQGLTPRKDDEAWVTEQLKSAPDTTAAEQEEKVRITLLEARCSQDTGMAQALADLEASYQAPLIRENQSALNQAKQAVQDFNADIDKRYRSSQ